MKVRRLGQAEGNAGRAGYRAAGSCGRALDSSHRRDQAPVGRTRTGAVCREQGSERVFWLVDAAGRPGQVI